MRLYVEYCHYMSKNDLLQPTLAKALKIWTCCGICHIFDMLKPKKVLEIGRYTGHSLGLFAWLAPNAKIMSIDPHPRPHSDKLAEWFEADITLVNQKSSDAFASGKVEDFGPFDFALIDGDHSYQGALHDWQNVRQVMSPNGVVVMDNIEMPCGKVFHDLQDMDKHEPFHVSFRKQPGDGGHYGIIFMGERP